MKMKSVPRAEQVGQFRSVERLVVGNATSGGASVKLTRVLARQLQHRLNPFLMLAAFGSDNPDDYIAGFPDHPHRGFETVTYMIAGLPLIQPIAQYGPFVMNTSQALNDFRDGRLTPLNSG